MNDDVVFGILFWKDTLQMKLVGDGLEVTAMTTIFADLL